MELHHPDIDWESGPLLQTGRVRADSDLARSPQAVLAWLGACRPALDAALARTGALKFRGLALRTAVDFNASLPHLGDAPLRYEGGASPRAQIHGAVYESTQWPWFFRIPLHNEMSYLRSQPGRVVFFCAQAPRWGGATLVGDMAALYRALPAATRERFERHGVRYVRHFSGTPGPWARAIRRVLRDNMQQTWREAFRTDDRREVEGLCEEQGLQWTWTPGDGLRVESVLPAVRPHPHTGEPVWFNQSTTMHPNRHALGPVIYPYLRLKCPDPGRYPFNVLYGDGSPIPVADLLPVYAAMQRHTLAPSWAAGDLMLLDNRWVAHGRGVYLGRRQIQVALLR